jgi:hypothetical protein
MRVANALEHHAILTVLIPLFIEDNHDLRESVMECLTLAGLAPVG